MKPMRRSGSLRFSALSLLATVSPTGNPVISAEPKSDAQQQARELLSGTSRDIKGAGAERVARNWEAARLLARARQR
jgi:hypothetical protein